MAAKNTFVKHVLPDFKNTKMQNTDLKNIISTFIKQPVDSINENTVIDKTVVQGSILIHRMYAEIADLGFTIDNYSNIRTFGELLKITDNSNEIINILDTVQPTNTFFIDSNNTPIGIDIEKVSNFKEVSDYREDNFYKQNFTASEIAYCTLQPNVLQSFAGKFAAKEAIVKADNNYKKIPYNKIEIENNTDGKPSFREFSISISHTDNIAVAVAIKNNNNVSEIGENSVGIINNSNSNIKYLSITALMLSLFSLLYIIFQYFSN